MFLRGPSRNAAGWARGAEAVDTLVAAGEIALLVPRLLLAWRMPRRLGARLQRAGRYASQFARRRGLAILAVGLIPIVFSIARRLIIVIAATSGLGKKIVRT